MVKGIEAFKTHFAGHEDSYALIGGAACDILFGEAGLPFRATKDFDMVLCVEVVSADFAGMFTSFLDAGGYQARERSTGRREFYRFHRPNDDNFPSMIELFARTPDTLVLPEGVELAPIPVEDDVLSLSAILLDDDYYAALETAKRTVDGISLVDETVLIPFKTRAFLDLSARKAAGENVDVRHIRKHRADVFRLIQLLPATGSSDLGDPIRRDLSAFLTAVSGDADFDYSAFKLPLSYDDATVTLRRFYQLS